jgi:hypothetical protein
VLDIPGGYGKSPIGPSYVSSDGRVEDFNGRLHCYPPQRPQRAADKQAKRAAKRERRRRAPARSKNDGM